jgi:hypothetical protein
LVPFSQNLYIFYCKECGLINIRSLYPKPLQGIRSLIIIIIIIIINLAIRDDSKIYLTLKN